MTDEIIKKHLGRFFLLELREKQDRKKGYSKGYLRGFSSKFIMQKVSRHKIIIKNVYVK